MPYRRKFRTHACQDEETDETPIRRPKPCLAIVADAERLAITCAVVAVVPPSDRVRLATAEGGYSLYKESDMSLVVCVLCGMCYHANHVIVVPYRLNCVASV
jgi:hypothetical protein